MMHTHLAHLYQGKPLTQTETQDAFTQILEGKVDPIVLSAFLVALKLKGETVDEIAGAALALREHAVDFPAFDAVCADSCGTGGDGSNTINVSTTAAIVAAACGIPMVKHGNRSVSSRSGSADLLAALGVNLDMSPEVAHRCLTETQLTFLFAPHYHQGIRHAMPVRSALKTRTIFNVLGPLLNPAQPQIQLLGVYTPTLCRPIAEALKQLGLTRALVVHGSGTDEIALHGSTHVVELNHGELTEYELTPETLGVSQYPLDAIEGGSPEENAAVTQAILRGDGEPAHKAAIAVNVGALLYLHGQANTISQGVEQALAMLATNKPALTLEQFAHLSQQ